MSQFLKLPAGELARLAELQRREGLKRVLGRTRSTVSGVRALILRKCHRSKTVAVAAIFETAPFGELERLVTQKLLEVAKGVAQKELGNEEWLRRMTHSTGRSYQEMRVLVLEFLDTTAFQVSLENYASFLDPLIESWDIDLSTFDLTITLHDPTGGGVEKRFGFVEKKPEAPASTDGFRQFLQDTTLSGTATEEELELLERLAFPGKRPTALFYYRELQNLRDPLHFED
jgi:hypothetical protein